MVTEVTFYPIKPTEKGFIGIASCHFDNKLSLNSISVYLTKSGDIRLLFPNKVLPNSKSISVYYPTNSDAYEEIRNAIKMKIENVNEKVSTANDKLYPNS